MNKRHLAFAAGIAVLIGLALVLLTVRPKAALTLRCSKVAVLGDGLLVSFDISNRTSQPYSLRPVRLERFESNEWIKVFDGIGSFSETGDFGARRQGALGCVVKQLPAGTRMRLVIESQRARKGLETIAVRVRVRLSGDQRMSLNPFDGVLFFTDPVELTTEEFLAP